MNTTTFQPFPKMARLSRECIITEKIDGTNAQLFVWDELKALPGDDPLHDLNGGTVRHPRPNDVPWLWTGEGISVAAGSRTRWITPADDNFGFARWVAERAAELAAMGHGRHFGEWWGSGIQRGYGVPKGERLFSLFNVSRWCLHENTPQRIPAADPRVEKLQDVLPPCVGLVPVLYQGLFDTAVCDRVLENLRDGGSEAAPGFMKPEGIVCFHVAANACFKKTLERDEAPKSAT